MTVKELKDALGLPNRSAGTKDEMVKTFYPKELEKALEADRTKLQAWHSSYATWIAELQTAYNERFHDGLSPAEVAEIESVLQDGSQAAKYVAIAGAFSVSSVGNTSLRVGALAQTQILDCVDKSKGDQGTFHTKASAKVTSTSLKLYVDSRDETDQPYVLRFPRRVVTCTVGTDAAIGIVKQFRPQRLRDW